VPGRHDLVCLVHYAVAYVCKITRAKATAQTTAQAVLVCSGRGKRRSAVGNLTCLHTTSCRNKLLTKHLMQRRWCLRLASRYPSLWCMLQATQVLMRYQFCENNKFACSITVTMHHDPCRHAQLHHSTPGHQSKQRTLTHCHQSRLGKPDAESQKDFP